MFLKKECFTFFSTFLKRRDLLDVRRSIFFPVTSKVARTIDLEEAKSCSPELRPCKWGYLDLPIYPRVASPHKKFRKALDASRQEISEDFYRELDGVLRMIRKENWHKWNSYGLDLENCERLQGLLEKLLSFENRLPEVMLKRLGGEQFVKGLFGLLSDAIECLAERSSKQPTPFSSVLLR